MRICVFSLFILAAMNLFLTGCEADATRRQTAAGNAERPSDGVDESQALHAIDVLREGMSEPDVYAVLLVTHADFSRCLCGFSTVVTQYICRGKRFPSEYVDCEFVVTEDKLSEDRFVWKLRRWRAVDDLDTIATLDLVPVESDFAIRQQKEVAAQLRALETEADKK